MEYGRHDRDCGITLVVNGILQSLVGFITQIATCAER